MVGGIVSTNTLKSKSSSVMDRVAPKISVTCASKLAYPSLGVDGTIMLALKS